MQFIKFAIILVATFVHLTSAFAVSSDEAVSARAAGGYLSNSEAQVIVDQLLADVRKQAAVINTTKADTPQREAQYKAITASIETATRQLKSKAPKSRSNLVVRQNDGNIFLTLFNLVYAIRDLIVARTQEPPIITLIDLINNAQESGPLQIIPALTGFLNQFAEAVGGLALSPLFPVLVPLLGGGLPALAGLLPV